MKVRAHTCYLGKTGYASHAREFFRALSKHVDLKVRNFTWDDTPSYLNDTDLSILDQITLSNNNGSTSDYPISHAFPKHDWNQSTELFVPDVDIVLMDMDHHYFYDDYSSKIKIAYTVWESTELPENFFNQLLKFDYLWVVTQWHKQVAINQGYPEYRVFVVNEGVSEDFMTDLISTTLSEYEDNRFKFLFFGRWDYRKSVPEIIKTFLDTFKNNEAVDLVISADNPYSIDGMTSTEERLEKYGLTDPRIKVKHFVSREEYIAYIKTGNVFVSCARSEGWNIPLIEAMAAGTPAIYSNWGAQLEFAEGLGIPVQIDRELPASIGSDLGFAGNTPGNYAEPDFTDLGKQMRSAFENYQNYKDLAEIQKNMIREKFSWENVSNQAMNALLQVSDYELDHSRSNEIAVIMSHANTKEKEGLLRLSIISLKRQGFQVIVSSHIPVSSEIHNISDYVIYDKDNPIVYSDEYSALSNTVPVHYIQYPDFGLTYSFDFNHGYAALKLIKNGLAIANINKYEKVHFVNYDYIIKDSAVLINHSNLLDEFDVVSYEWDQSQKSLNSGFFSCRVKCVSECLIKFNSKQDYFSFDGVVILEDFLHRALSNDGINMHLMSINTITKNNSLNSIVLSTYPSIPTKDGESNYLYLTKEKETGEYILCIVGSLNSPLKVELEYSGLKQEFISDCIHKPMTLVSIPEHMVINGFEVNLPEYNEKRKYNMESKMAVSRINGRGWVEKINFIKSGKKVNINFIDGPFVEILGEGPDKYRVDFIDQLDNQIVYSTEIGLNCWTRASRRYFTNWLIRLTNLSNGELDEYVMDLEDKVVKISLDSRSLGDSIAWFPHIDEFQKKHNCRVYVSTFNNNLFKENYPNLNFVLPGQNPTDIYAQYTIGWFYNGDSSINNDLNPRDFKKIPMQATTTDILGLPETSLRPNLVKPVLPSPINSKYVCIGMHSTAQAKYWNNKNGWQELTDYFIDKGYKVIMLSVEEDGYMNNYHPLGIEYISGPKTLENAINYLQYAEMFIGVGSGLSWLSWAVGIPTVIISGFSSPLTEPLDDKVIRIFNGGSCNSCFNRHRLDAGDWNWCPDNKGTNKQFECTKTISSKMVIDEIENFYTNNQVAQKSIEVIIQESYDLGMVQNHIEILGAANHFKSQKVTNFMEIGTDQGGSFAIWSKLSNDGIRISVDLPHGEFGRSDYDEYQRDEYLKSLGSNVTMIWGSSHDISIKEQVANKLNGTLLDFLFIDGDHTYEGVKKDYEMYQEFVKPGGWIAFHDIKDTPYHRSANCRVDQLWNELKGNKVEFIDSKSNYGGIGFIQVEK